MESVWFETNDNGRKLLVCVSEGCGSALTKTDYAEGYISYINYETWELINNGLETSDSGIIMYKQPINEIFECLKDAIPVVLETLGIKSEVTIF